MIVKFHGKTFARIPLVLFPFRQIPSAPSALPILLQSNSCDADMRADVARTVANAWVTATKLHLHPALVFDSIS